MIEAAVDLTEIVPNNYTCDRTNKNNDKTKKDNENEEDFDNNFEADLIEKTVKLEICDEFSTRLGLGLVPSSALQRHNQEVTRFIKLHSESVPEFQDTTKLPGHIHNSTPIQETKLHAIWIILLKFLSSAEEREGQNCSDNDFWQSKRNVKQQKVFCKEILDNFLLSFGVETVEEIISDNFFSFSKDEILQKYFKFPTFQVLMEKIEKNPLSQEFFNQLSCDDPDSLLLRFLRARKWNLADTIQMIIDTLYWRRSFGIKGLICNGETSIYEYLLTCGKHYAWNVDLRGSLVIWITSKLHDKNKQTLHQNLEALVFLIEQSRRLMAPGCEMVSLVFDLSDAPLASLDLPSIQGDIHVLQNYYPECLGQCYIVDAPWIFNGLYKILKTFLDPVVVSKINLIKAADIVRHIHPAMVPKRYVGGCDPIEFKHSVKPSNSSMNSQINSDSLLEKLTKMRRDLINMTLNLKTSDAFDPHGPRAALRSDLKMLTKSWESGFIPQSHYNRCDVLDELGNVNWNKAKNF